MREELYGIGVDSTNRLTKAFALLFGLLPEDGMRLIADAWESSDLVWQQMTRTNWRTLKTYKVAAAGKAKPWMWPSDRAGWKKQRRHIIYRGGATVKGSWTLSQEVALTFARGRRGSPKAKLFTGEILTENILLYLTGRQEQEIVPSRFNAILLLKELEFV